MGKEPADMVKELEIFLDYLRGHNVIIRVLIREKQKCQSQKEI